MFASFCHASGIIIITASGRLRPPRTRSSRTLSKAPTCHMIFPISNFKKWKMSHITQTDTELPPESEEVASTIGRIIDSSSLDRPRFSHPRRPSRAVILPYKSKDFKDQLRSINLNKISIWRWLCSHQTTKMPEGKRFTKYYQFLFPLRVLISPLWPKTRIGCARSQLGKVFVENRE
jgi:hypothetical protein